MYCGACIRDNALAAELMSRGHQVELLPLYTPTLTDEPNVSQDAIFFGGINVYLQQHFFSVSTHTAVPGSNLGFPCGSQSGFAMGPEDQPRSSG